MGHKVLQESLVCPVEMEGGVNQDLAAIQESRVEDQKCVFSREKCNICGAEKISTKNK